jgi:hypothetical protein
LKVKSKLLLVKRKTLPWFNIAGAHIQGEVYVKKNGEIQLHGRAVIVMPNFFVLAATFDYNRLVEGQYLMLDLIKPNQGPQSFERKFSANYVPFLVNNSQAINKYLFDSTSISKLATICAYSHSNRAAYDAMKKEDYSCIFPSDEFALDVGPLRQAVADFYLSPNGGRVLTPRCLGMTTFTPRLTHFKKGEQDSCKCYTFIVSVESKLGLTFDKLLSCVREMWSKQGSGQSALHEAAQQVLTYINQHKHQRKGEIYCHLYDNNKTGFADLLLSTFVPTPTVIEQPTMQ